ncbi:MAG: sugar phosphate isomerase/epimerase [Capsulimonadaceae bacterium]|nr:sugar phosphate isomerase/epimerase [Capsulimonadaceae bacterium]
MKKSISQWAFDPNRPLVEVFALAKRHGFDAVELAVDETGPVPLDLDQEGCQRIIDHAASAGVEIASLASGLGWRYPITSRTVATRRKGIDAIAKSLAIAGWLGTNALLVVPGGVGAEFIDGFDGTPYDEAFANAMDAVAELIPIAKQYGVAIAVENVWNKFLLSPLEMRDFIDKADPAFTGCYFDVGNVILTGYPEQWVAILGQRIKRVHLKDFKRSVGTLDGFCGLLEGDVNYPAVIAALRATGYDGPLTAEYFNCEHDLDKLSKAMDKILGM